MLVSLVGHPSIFYARDDPMLQKEGIMRHLNVCEAEALKDLRPSYIWIWAWQKVITSSIILIG